MEPAILPPQGPSQQAIQPSPGTPLYPVSPERANQQKVAAIRRPSSPSTAVSSDATSPVEKQPTHTSSDAIQQIKDASASNKPASKPISQAKQDAITRRLAHEAALRRALLGREEAESQVLSLRSELSELLEQVEEGRERERRVGERLESVMEELVRRKETSTHSSHLYEKEVRKVRKEAFKSSSAVVKLQEELKASRAEVRSLKKEAAEEKEKVEEWRQKAFEREYEVVGLRGEVEALKARVGVVEQERDALKVRMEVEEVARIAAEGQIALPAGDVQEGDDDEDEEKVENFSPVKRRATSPAKPARPTAAQHSAPLDSPTSGDASTEALLTSMVAELKEELAFQSLVAQEAEGTIGFMQMECQLKICSCRLLESQSRPYIHDPSFDAAKAMQSMRKVWSDAAPAGAAERPRSRGNPTGERPVRKARTPSRQQYPHPPSTAPSHHDNAHTASTHHHDPRQPQPQSRPTSSHTQLHPPQPPSHARPLSTFSPTPPHQHAQPYTLHSTTTLIPLAPSTPTTASTASSSPAVPKSLPPGSLTRSRSRPHPGSPTNHPHPHSVARLGREERSDSGSQDWKSTFPLTPSREQALAQIRERRGRARSVAEGRLGVTPRRAAPQAAGGERGEARTETQKE